MPINYGYLDVTTTGTVTATSGNFTQSVLTSGNLIFANGNTPPVGVLSWDNGEGTVRLGLKGGNVTASLAQDSVILCNNGTASSLSKGQVVYVSGVQGQRPRVNLASAASELTSSRTIGVVDETITSGSEGFVATFGVVNSLNTSSFIEGSGLWLSATTPGGLTMTRPAAPNHGVFVGWCLNSHASTGRIFVEVQNGYELEEIHDVLITSPASGDILRYDSSNSTWKNTALPAGGGGSPYIVYSPTSTTTLTETSGVVIVLANATSANLTVNLPTAVSNTATINVKKTDSSANTVIIDANGSQTIDGSLTKTIEFQNTCLTIISNNSNWLII